MNLFDQQRMRYNMGGTLLISSILLWAISAALIPESSIEPKVGPILASPKVSVTDIPAAIRPGNTSPVLLTTSSSPPSTHIGSIPFQFTYPLDRKSVV